MQYIKKFKKFRKALHMATMVLTLAIVESTIVEKNPQMIIRKAAEVCQELKTRRLSTSRITHPDVDADILNSLAPEYYCREFDD